MQRIMQHAHATCRLATKLVELGGAIVESESDHTPMANPAHATYSHAARDATCHHK